MLNSILLVFNFGTGEIIIIVLVILLLFGGRKIPELMRGLGRGIKSFKEGMNEVKDEIEKPINEGVNEVKNAVDLEPKDSGTKSNGK